MSIQKQEQITTFCILSIIILICKMIYIHSGSAVQIRVTINSRRQYTRRANSETWVGSHCFLGPYGRYLERGPYDQTVCKDTKYTQ